MRRRLLLCVAVLALGALGCRSRARVPAEWPYPLDVAPARAAHAMVVSDSPPATRVGVAVLAAGGNAVDAAVAVAFALAVVYPEAGNLGGGGFALVRTADGGTAALDFRETAPAAATRDMYAGAPRDSRVGARASGVPGSVAGLAALHERFGKRPWAELVAPAIALAEDGFIADDRLAATVADSAVRLATQPLAAATWLPGGKPIAAGTRIVNPELAAVLRRVAEQGPNGLYRGVTAELIVAEMERGGGLITLDDLRDYRPVWREPLAIHYRGYTLWAMPPPSSGGVTLALIANILGAYDLRGLGWHSWQHLHLLAEAMRRAFVDRNRWLGDPDFVAVPHRLLDEDYAARRRATIDPARATPSPEVGPGPAEGANTTHFAVADGAGMTVALTTTLNELFGSAVLVRGAGFFLNDEMDDFAAQPGKPNAFGLVQGEANAVAPRKRPLSSMTPTIVVGPDGNVVLIAGARGGPRIISATFQVISNVVDFGMGVGAAVSAPRIHHQHLPDEIYYEDHGLSDALMRELRARGHTLTLGPTAMGNAPALVRAGAEWTGLADPRRGGLAAGN